MGSNKPIRAVLDIISVRRTVDLVCPVYVRWLVAIICILFYHGRHHKSIRQQKVVRTFFIFYILFSRHCSNRWIWSKSHTSGAPRKFQSLDQISKYPSSVLTWPNWAIPSKIANFCQICTISALVSVVLVPVGLVLHSSNLGSHSRIVGKRVLIKKLNTCLRSIQSFQIGADFLQVRTWGWKKAGKDKPWLFLSDVGQHLFF